ncbi:D-alanyl-D-alanine carboxypeptidase precursor [Micromonospora sp. MW-13]|uniref:serine hydrolase domain-containing protein n=1 Tax=Micromonospora sp. MW-13 TaxID=2094022 RepID=UPI000ED5D2A7|nr:serine hydrolase domain-containing protein [Micromonospora sp. MW-13]RGC69041.1 D-alanyl-D-alanine carboxypeptidase precursor [Micromonospora sp. MW-13]
MKIMNRRTVLVATSLGALLTITAPGAVTAAPRTPDAGAAGSGAASTAALGRGGTLDPGPLRAAIAGLPGADATSAQVRITTPEGCWTDATGVRDLRTQAPVPPHARFRVGSVSKVFTAALVLRLASEGRVDLDGSVQGYLPGLLPADYPTVTVRQLLDHTSGIPSPAVPGDVEWQLAHRYDRWTPEQIVRLGLDNRREFEPGEKQHYTNMGYIVAGLLIEKVTGHSYAAELDRRIARPLGLRDTYAPGDDPRIHGPHAHGYQAVVRGGATELVDATTWSQTFTPASGDVISSLADLDTFTTALFAGRVVPEPQLTEMFTLPPVDDAEGGPARYSAGLTALALPSGETLWAKTGSRFGYLAAVASTRDGRFRVEYSITATDAKGEELSVTAQAVIAAALGLA